MTVIGRSSRRTRAPWLVVPAAAVAAALWGAGQAPGQDEQWWPAVFRDATRVTVVNVDVVVTDRQGRPVGGLERNDFELYENGRRVEITNFRARAGEAVSVAEGAVEEPGSEASPAPEEPFHLAIFFDNAGMTSRGRRGLAARLGEQIGDTWHSRTRALLATGNRGLVVRQPFTADRERLLASVEELERLQPGHDRLELEERTLIREMERTQVDTAAEVDINDDGAVVARVVTNADVEAAQFFSRLRILVEQRHQRVVAVLGALRQLIDSLAGIPGRKAVLFVSEGVNLQPAAALFEGFDRHFELLPGTVNSVSAPLESARYDSSRELQELIAHANAAGTTFYTLDTSDGGLGRHGSAEVGTSFWNTELGGMEASNNRDSLVRLAQGTGGRTGVIRTGTDDLLASVYTDLDNHYSLGYSPTDPDSTETREIEVKVADRDLRVLYRESFRLRSLQERLEQRTLSALSGADIANPLEITVEPREEQPGEGETFTVPFVVKVPLGKLVLLPGEQQHQARVSIFLAARDEQGRTSPIVRHLCPVRIPNSEILLAMGRTAGCGLRLSMRPGRQLLAVSVLDELATLDSTVRMEVDVGAGAPEPSS